MTIAYIGLGSNLDNPVQNISSALQSMRETAETSLVKYSSFYESKPVGPSGQADYINAVAELETKLSAFELLEKMQLIENQHGRIRDGERWGPRTLDLDLLVFGDECIDEFSLIVPHPEIKNRNFVLCPLVEISEDLHIPGLGFAKDLLQKTGQAGLKKLEKYD